VEADAHAALKVFEKGRVTRKAKGVLRGLKAVLGMRS